MILRLIWNHIRREWWKPCDKAKKPWIRFFPAPPRTTCDDDDAEVVVDAEVAVVPAPTTPVSSRSAPPSPSLPSRSGSRTTPLLRLHSTGDFDHILGYSTPGADLDTGLDADDCDAASAYSISDDEQESHELVWETHVEGDVAYRVLVDADGALVTEPEKATRIDRGEVECQAP